MTPQIVVIVLGSILILAGLLGGGFELKELKMPRIGGPTRVFSLIGGIAILAWGLNMKTQNTGHGHDGSHANKSASKPHMGVLEFDTNRQGSDISYFQTPSVNECSEACLRNDDCMAMTFVQGASGGTCWLKSVKPPKTPRQGMISAEKVLPN